MKYPLAKFLSGIKDFRRGQGQRYPLDKTLLMIIMSIINGANGYRKMARFMKLHEKSFVKYFKLKHGVPSHVTVRAIFEGLDLESFNKKFIKWMSRELKKPKDKWVSLDGKSIKSTVKNPNGEFLDFVQVVSIFAHNSELVIGQKSFTSKKAKEAEYARQMIEELDEEGLFICLDALHCQKKL